MPGDNCLVCATNEGVFVDVEEQPELRNKAKNCRLDKVWEESETTKVCHKCAFELDQCSVFVEKVKKASKAQNAKKDSCVLCFGTQEEDTYLFDLSKQKNGANGLIQRLQDQFSDELKNKELKKIFICLSCRYCVDLLADLKALIDEVHSKLKSVRKDGIDPADLPKTKTIIASRKTTYIESSNFHLNTPSDTDSDTSSIMGSKKRVSKTSKSTQSSQKCGQCRKAFDKDAATYRLFKTGKTLCKQCWLKTDFSKTASKKRKKVNYPANPLCSVVLKDLYQTSQDDEYTITEDDKGNTIFKVIGSSHVQHKDAQNEKSNERKDSEKSVHEKEAEHENESAETIEITRQKEDSEKSVHEEEAEHEDDTAEPSRQRKDSEQSEKEEDIPAESSQTNEDKKDSDKSEDEEASKKPSQATRRRKDSELSNQESIDAKSTRASRRRKDSEQSVQEVVESKPVRSGRRRKESEQSVQEVSETISTRTRTRKNSEQSVQSVEVKTSSRSRRRKDSEKSEIEEIEIDVDSDSGPANKRAKTETKSKVQNQSKRKRGRSSSIESTDSVRKSARNAKRHTRALDEIIEIDDNASDTDKVEKELTRPKRSRKENNVSYDEPSDAESDKVQSKKSSPASSKEPTPERQSAAASPSRDEDSTNVTEVLLNETQPKELESSESEEIDILKSTDEESKNDESPEKGNAPKIVSDVEIESEHDVSDKSVGKADDSQVNDEPNEDAHSDAASANPEELEAIEETPKDKSVERDVVETEENDDLSVSKNKSDEDQDLSDDGKENKAVSKRRSTKKNARKSGKKSRKSRVKSLEDIATVAEASDSEQVKEPTVTTYTCTKCDLVFDSKYEGLQHEITHAKLLKVSLEKVAVPESRKSSEKMDVDEDTEIPNENDDVLSKKSEDVEMTEVNNRRSVNLHDDLDRIDTVNEDEPEPETDKATEQNESDTEVTPSKRGRRASRRQSNRVSDEKREKKTRGRRKISNEVAEPEVTTAVIEAEPNKILDALNDVPEPHENENEQEESQTQEEEKQQVESQQEEEERNIEQEEEHENTSEKEPEIETIEHEVESGSEPEAEATTQVASERSPEIETHDIADDSSRDEVICESNNEESRDAEPEEAEHPIVNLDDEASGDVVDVESDAKKRSEESEVEITEIEDVPSEEGEAPEPVVECEQVDLTEKDEDVPQANEDDDDDIEEIEQEPSRNVHEDENTVDSVTEINVMAAAEPTVENDTQNPRHNDDTEEEDLAQQSLEDVLQRDGLQIVDEVAETVTDGDDESEKEVNVSLEKEKNPRKKGETDNELEIRISDSECTEILEVNNKTPSKKSVDGEVQITQDVDVVEEVVNNDVQPAPENNVAKESDPKNNDVSYKFPTLY